MVWCSAAASSRGEAAHFSSAAFSFAAISVAAPPRLSSRARADRERLERANDVEEPRPTKALPNQAEVCPGLEPGWPRRLRSGAISAEIAGPCAAREKDGWLARARRRPASPPGPGLAAVGKPPRRENRPRPPAAPPRPGVSARGAVGTVRAQMVEDDSNNVTFYVRAASARAELRIVATPRIYQVLCLPIELRAC